MNQRSGTNTASSLEHFPVTFFAMIMGMTGLTLAWKKGSRRAARADYCRSDIANHQRLPVPDCGAGLPAKNPAENTCVIR